MFYRRQLGSPSNECALSLRFIFTSSILVVSTPICHMNAGFTTVRWVYSMPCDEGCASRSLGHFAATTARSSHRPRVHSLDPSIVKTASRRCVTKGCVSKSLKRLLLDWNRF
jgi:hypothetical protein